MHNPVVTPLPSGGCWRWRCRLWCRNRLQSICVAKIFIKRKEAIRLLIRTRSTIPDGGRVPLTDSDNAKVAALDRLLLDVRAGRTDEFRLDEDGPRIVITN
ncbi:hypothetical protein [Paraburkholderia tropica]|uniref:hypothetical protein n=1 Tax=Paraburkholderia tropica TaxID=92647 RepID=UPI0035A21C5A